jgi:peptidoglycan hydrolase-like protein with peptidoglycan-binding domain
MNTRALIGGAVAVVVAGGVAAAFAFDSSSPASSSIDNTSATALATVRRQSLSSQTQVNATLGYAGSGTIVAAGGRGGIYTALPKPGQVVRMGHALYWVNGEPVILLYGSVTPWRPFQPGMSAGADVAELNAALGLSGDEFTSATEARIKAFQKEHGLAETGVLQPGAVVFEPGPVRVTAVTPVVGSPVQPGPVLTFTTTKRQVTIQLDAAQQSEVKVGDPVAITLPDNSTTPGKVTFVGSVATTPSSSGGNSNPTVEVDVTPTQPTATGRLDQAPVEVSITTASVSNVLVVPVNSLLALASGGYAVEVSVTGVRHLVPVQLGLFDDASGLVQVTGNLHAGEKIVVPAS